MDGVLVDTEPIIFRAFRRVFSAMNIALDDAYLHGLVGDSTDKNLADIQRDFAVTLDAPAVKEQLHRDYVGFLQREPVPVRSQTVRFLTQAKKHGLHIGLCTSSRNEIVRIVLHSLDQQKVFPVSAWEWFESVITGSDVVNKKPHQEPYQVSAKRLSVGTERCLVLEDSAAGVESAKSAGCRCVALRAPYNQHMDFSKADWVLDHLDDRLFWPETAL
jgi:HAD superfamily hydrolase (TIGR01509 family)